MDKQLAFENVSGDDLKPYVHRGPLLKDLLSSASTQCGTDNGAEGYDELRRALGLTPASIIDMINAAGLRGRGGGGFPTGHKWNLVAQAQNKERYFICNANAGQPGGFKESFLIQSNPHRIIEATLLAAYAMSATTALICLPSHLETEARLLENAAGDAHAKYFAEANLGRVEKAPSIIVYRVPRSYITGEETALMEMIEGRAAIPRGKPPLPCARGLFEVPTAVNNLETVLHAYHIVKNGAARFREIGTKYSPGSMIFSVSGHVERPGLYEIPLGTTLRDLIFGHANGVISGARLKVVLPGGVCSPALNNSSLDLPLDYDTAHETGFDLGSGAVIVVSEQTSAVELARCLAAFFHEKSCGKCQPCKDGTRRTLAMLNRLDRLDERSIDILDRVIPPSPRMPTLKILNNPQSRGAISYTDTVQGLDKIRHLCEFYKHRGDCHHSVESANSIQRLLDLFRHEFESHRKSPNATLEANLAK